MKYKNPEKGVFIDRPNRFIAHVEIGGKDHTVHVKNTGRCRELLIPGAEVILDRTDNPGRKTLYDLVAVKKPTVGWVNIDTQAPNKVALEYLQSKDYDYIKPEYTFGASRIDFYMEKNIEGTLRRYLMEVKGCTLEIDGTGYFPDAPTTRGVKHLKELSGAIELGFHPILAFVIQMNGVNTVLPNEVTDPKFTEAFMEAKARGVEVLFLPCDVHPDGFSVKGELH